MYGAAFPRLICQPAFGISRGKFHQKPQFCLAHKHFHRDEQ
jgi:hypothetical protein